jgi:hypothetical protein
MSRITKNILLIAVIAILILAVIASGCCGILNGNNPGSGGSTKAKQAVHGSISTGTPVDAAQGTFISMGGTITVNKPDSPINGLTIEAPAGAYQSSQPVKVSYSPISGQTFGTNFNPVSPMITIDAGQEYADQPLQVTIPINITEDQFPMAFYYNGTDKNLEGIPTVKYDTHSITITTRHFCDVVVSAILNGTLDAVPVADSGFKPGTDDWEFDNAGSYIAPTGHCSGQSLTMMWYYTEQRQKLDAPKLNGRFDNNGRSKTPDVPRDDTMGYRIASVTQVDDNWDAYSKLIDPIFTSINNSTTFYCFKYSILMTGEPQYVFISRDGGAHAIVCYKVAGNTMYIADPNYPGKERAIQINGYNFTPYSSGDNSQDIAASGVRIYPRIYYLAKSALISWDTLAADYAKMQAGTIGDDKFPTYDIGISIYPNDTRQNMIAYKNAGKNDEVKRVTVNVSKISYMFTDNEVPSFPNGHIMVEATYKGETHTTGNMKWPIKLDNGSNIVAVEVYGSVNGKWKWMGFNYIDFYYQPDASPTPLASNERKPDRALHDVNIPTAPAPLKTANIKNNDGSHQNYTYYTDSQKVNRTHGYSLSYWPNGQLKSNATFALGKNIGYARSYFNDGTPNYIQYRGDDGILQYQDYYASNGKLRLAVDYYGDGKTEKDRFDYGDNGGPLQYYYEYGQSGTQKLKETWSNGKLTG